ncbi:MAG: DUF1800 family protein [Brumimicrobium sp.]
MLFENEVDLPVSLSVNPYTGAWTKDEAAHLLRRTLFGPTFQQIQDTVALGMDDAVDQLLSTVATPPPLTTSPDEAVATFGTTWVNSPYTSTPNDTETARRTSLAAWIMERLNKAEYSIQEQMCLFWQNHFAAEFTFDSRATYNYHEVIRTHCLGNFKQLVKDITIDPCMLVFLSGAVNNQFSPNENFARELLELYTVGKGPQIGAGDYTNYKEHDIVEASKILTGWTIQGFLSETETTTSAVFNPALHDTSTKTLSEHFDNAVIPANGANEYEDLIDTIFLEDEVANFICKKLYRWFVNYDLTTVVENTVVSELADTLRLNNYNILPVLEQLFKSEHFYDVSLRGTIIKNPLEHFYSIYNSTLSTPNHALEVNYDLYAFAYQVGAISGMSYAQPPSVGGWTAYYQAPAYSRLWANSSFIKLRFDFSDFFNLAGGIDVNGNKWAPNHLDFLDNLSNPSSAPDVIDDMVTVFCPKGLDNAKKATLKAILTNGLPDFEWTIQYNEYQANPTDPAYVDPVKFRVALTLAQLFKMPEFQTI